MESTMVADGARRYRVMPSNGLKVLRRDIGQNKCRLSSEAEAAIVIWISKYNAPGRTSLAQIS